ncbi:alpha/beta fold hydrolase [Nonomuraea spiralis]|uniref:Alpha/beta fold hydrolase n=1 Tax=Nonomuraea spiralis TaxID=46182 RepID=A0ABV5I560_9ACTN|nr:alpha/beta fold hydrolase [Nonomuraea spiralis]GGS62888.1 alpha/beta hydrolase [Nonomuraea spiralis]
MAGLFSRRLDPRPPGGPVVVLLHGFGSDGQRDWLDTGTAAMLAAFGHTVIVPDLPGHGSSPDPATAAEAHAPAIARAVLDVLDGVERFDLVGYSLGARIAWELPALAGDRLGRCVLGGLAPGEPFAGVDVAALRRAVTYGEQPSDPFTAMIAGLARTPGRALCVEGLRETPFTARSWSGKLPPVFVVGQDDGMTAGIEHIVELTPGAELVRVPGGHVEALAGAGLREAVVKVLQG